MENDNLTLRQQTVEAAVDLGIVSATDCRVNFMVTSIGNKQKRGIQSCRRLQSKAQSRLFDKSCPADRHGFAN